MRNRSAIAVIAGAAAVFLAAAAWAATRVFGGSATEPRGATSVVAASGSRAAAAGQSAAGTGRAFLAAWARGDFDAMQELVADQNDSMQHVYGGLAERLHVTRVAIVPGALDASGTSLGFRATLTVAGHPWTYTGAVPLTHTARGWRVAFTSATVHPNLANGQTLTLQPADAPVRLLDRSGHDLSTDDDLDRNLFGTDGESGLRGVVAARAPNGGGISVVRVDAGTSAVLETLATWGVTPHAGDVRTTLDLGVQRAAERVLERIPGTAALVAVDTRPPARCGRWPTSRPRGSRPPSRPIRPAPRSRSSPRPRR